MEDIWNPWHGCTKVSEGCKYCYMYEMDQRYQKDGSMIYKTKSKFNYPLQKDKQGNYKIKSGELIRICMASDFFLEEADKWREEVWAMIRIRSDVKFFILTKRPERIKEQLPSDWGLGYDNVILNVSCENQSQADKRIPILLSIPSKHKGIMVAPFVGELFIDHYLATQQIEQVICGGENYGGNRPCHFDWVKTLHTSCKKYHITFVFIETGTYFVLNNTQYYLPSKIEQSQLAFKSKMSFKEKEIDFRLIDCFGNVLKENELYKPHYKNRCQTCGSQLICNGCSECGKCT